ncbi:TBC1 domain family member 31 [Plasmodiophora brassicae]
MAALMSRVSSLIGAAGTTPSKPEATKKAAPLALKDIGHDDDQVESMKSPMADTTIDLADSSLKTQLGLLPVDQAVLLCVTIMRAAVDSQQQHDVSADLSDQLRIAVRFVTKLPDPSPTETALDQFVLTHKGLDILIDLARSPNVTRDAVRALYRVASVDAFLKAAVASQVPKAVVDLLGGNLLESDPSLQNDGLLLLGNLSFDPEARAAIGAAGGIDAILRILRRARSNSEQIDQCCYALANLAVSNHANSQTMIDLGAIDDIVRIMAMHSRDARLLESVMFVLTNLCADGETSRMQIVSAGGGRILGQVLEQHALKTSLVHAALRTLGNLACSAAAVQTLLRDGLVRILMGKLTEITGVHEKELAVLVLSNMAIEGDHQTFEEMCGADSIVPQLVALCTERTILMVVVGLLDTIAGKHPAFEQQDTTWTMVFPMLIASLPDLISPGHPDHERLRLEAVQHVYHAVGLLAGNPDHVDLVQNLHEFRNVLYTTLDFDVNATKEDVECTVQALWCLGRLIVPLSIEQIEAEKVVVRVQTLLGTLLAMLAPSDTNSEIWSAFAAALRLLSQLATNHRSINTEMARRSIPMLTKALVLFTDRKPHPDPETSAAFASLLSAISSSQTSLVHLGPDCAAAISKLLKTATSQDGTLTVASAATFIVLLARMAAADRRGNIRRALSPAVLTPVLKALQSGASIQFQASEPTKNSGEESVVTSLIQACAQLQTVLESPALDSTAPESQPTAESFSPQARKPFLLDASQSSPKVDSVRRVSRALSPAMSPPASPALRSHDSVPETPNRQQPTVFESRSQSIVSDSPASPTSGGSTKFSFSTGSISVVDEPGRDWDTLLDECAGDVAKLRSHPNIQPLVSMGVPAEHRAQVWRILSGSDQMRQRYNAGYYDLLVQIAQEHGSPAEVEIRKDIRRTLPHTDLFKTEDGVAKLERVLSAYCLRNSETVGYCQSMNNLCGALLTVLDEEDAFWVLSCMIETRVGYYCKSMCALLVDQRVLRDMLSYEEPQLYDHLTSHGVNLDTFTVSWFLCLFMEAPVRFEETLILWDNILMVGDELIFQFALGIFRSCRAQIMALDSDSELLVYFLHGMSKDIPPVSVLLKEIRHGDLTAELTALRELHEKAVVQESMGIRPGTLLNFESQYSFSEEEIDALWKAFLAPSPWHILLHASIPNSRWLQQSLAVSVFDKIKDNWRDHGLMSGLMDRLFIVIDTNGTKHVDFGEFLVAANILLKGSQDDRLQFCFMFADANDDHLISRDEMTRLVTMLEETYNGRQGACDAATRFVDDVFTDAQPSDSQLDYEEFSHFALIHPLVCSFFRLQPSPVLANLLPDRMLAGLLQRERLGARRHPTTPFSLLRCGTYRCEADDAFSFDGIGLEGEPVIPYVVQFNQVNNGRQYCMVADEDGFVSVLDTNIERRSTIYRRQLHQNAIFASCWIDNDSCFLTASGDRTCRVSNIETGAQIVACGHEASVKSVSAQRTNSKVFASGSRDGNVFIWDVRRLSHVPGSHLHPVAKLSSVHGAGQRSTRSRRSLPSPASQCVSAVQFVADDNILCTAGASDGTIKLFDLRKFATEHCVATYSMNANTGVSSLAVDELTGRSRLLVSYTSGLLNVFADCREQGLTEPIAFFNERAKLKNSFYVKSCFSPCGRYILSGAATGRLLLFDSLQPHIAADIEGSELQGDINGVAWSPHDFALIGACSDDGDIRLWRYHRNDSVERHPRAQAAPVPAPSPATTAPNAAVRQATLFQFWDRRHGSARSRHK